MKLINGQLEKYYIYYEDDEVAEVQSKWSEKVNKSIIGIMEMKSHKRHPVCGVDL